MKYQNLWVISSLLLSSVSAQADNIQDLNSLKIAAENYALSNISLDGKKRTEITSADLDPRLRLTACDGPLVAFTPPGSRLQGNSTVGVRCDSPQPWSIYIPIKIAIFQQAMVVTSRMARGQLIDENDIAIREVDISRVKGRAFVTKDELIGNKLKTSLQSNQVIDSSFICLICKGDAVVITANSSAISVSMAGKALNDGNKGDKIRVQNNASRRIIDAIITDVGTVTAGI